MKRVLPIVFGIILFLASPKHPLAQTTSGNLAGSITDSTNARLPGVGVKAVSQQTGTVREAITNELGLIA